MGFLFTVHLYLINKNITMDGVDVLAELLITATIDQDTNKPKKGCSVWFFVFLIALALWIGYEFLVNK